MEQVPILCAGTEPILCLRKCLRHRRNKADSLPDVINLFHEPDPNDVVFGDVLHDVLIKVG